MKRSVGVLVLASCLLAGARPRNADSAGPPAEKRTPPPWTDAGIAEGPSRIERVPHRPARYGPARAKAVRVWTQGGGEQDWKRAHFGDKPVLRLQVGNTPYSLLLVGGRVEPLIATGTGVWRLEGLEKNFARVRDLRVTGKAVELIAGGGDLRSIYKLEFDPGLVVHYWEEYDGP